MLCMRISSIMVMQHPVRDNSPIEMANYLELNLSVGGPHSQVEPLWNNTVVSFVIQHYLRSYLIFSCKNNMVCVLFSGIMIAS